MSLVSTSALVAEAIERRRAVAAFNVISLEHAEAIAAGAEQAGTGAILQLSQNAVRFHGRRLRPILLACREVAASASVPLALHLDHIDDPELVNEGIDVAAEAGLGSIMIDASRLDYERNVAATAEATTRAHSVGLWVEAELGEIGGKDGAHAPGVRTDPDEAVRFVADTGVDSLAVAVGSSHAMIDRSASIDLDLIGRLAAALTVPLVLHGSSGVPDAELARAVEAGIRKVNVGTALNVAGTSALRSALGAAPEAVDPRAPLIASREAMADVVAHLCALVG